MKQPDKLETHEQHSQIEDLTLKEIEAENIKGGPSFIAVPFSFGIEREMKESGEKGGTE